MEVFFEEGPSVSFSIEKFSRNSADRGKFLETGTKLKSKNRSARVKGSVCSLPTNCADIFQGKIPILPIPISRPNSAQWQFLETKAELVEEWFCRSSNDLSVSSR